MLHNMRLLGVFLFFLCFQNCIANRHKRQFDLSNRDDDGNSPFSFGNSFDSQTTFEKQKANLMQELELKLAELRANNKQALANAVMELKHQLIGLGKTLLLGQTQQGLLLSAAAQAGRRKPDNAETTTPNGSDDEHVHHSLLTKLEELSRNFTKLTGNYRNALQEQLTLVKSSGSNENKQEKKTRVKSTAVKKQQKAKWKNDLDNSFYDLDDYPDLDSKLAVKTAKKSNAKEGKKQGEQRQSQLFKLKKPSKDLEPEKSQKVVYPVLAEQPPFYDQRPLPAVERSMVEVQGGGDQDQLSKNQYIYYLAGVGLAIAGYCCFSMTTADDANSQNQVLLKKQGENARHEKRRRRKSRKKLRRSKMRTGSLMHLHQHQHSPSIPPGNTLPNGALHLYSSSSVAAVSTADQAEAAEPVISFKANQVQQFCGAHSDMATRLEALISESRLILQMIEARKQSGLSAQHT